MMAYFKSLVEGREDILEFLGRLFLALVFVFAAGSIVYYQIFYMNEAFNHEAAYPLLYAESVIENASLYPHEFSGREVAPVTWVLFGVLLLLVGFPISIGTHIVYAVFHSLFMGAVVYYLHSLLKTDMKIRILALISTFTLFVSFWNQPYSAYQWLDQVFVWPMNSYGAYDALSLLVLAVLISVLGRLDTGVGVLASWKDRNATDARRYLVALLGFGVLVYLMSLNSMRGVLILVLPSVVPMIWIAMNRALAGKWPQNKELISLAAAALLLAGLGYLTTKLAAGDIPQPWQSVHAYLDFENAAQLGERIWNYCYQIMAIFGIEADRIEMGGFDSLIFVSRLGLLVMMFWLLFRPWGAERGLGFELTLRHSQFLVIAITLVVVFGARSQNVRYFIPIAYALLFFAPVGLNVLWASGRRAVVIIFAGLMVFNAGVGALALLNAGEQHRMVQYYRHSDYDNLSGSVEGLAAFLQEEGLTRGYIGPWNTHGLAINHFSGGQVRVGVINPLVEAAANGLPYSRHSHSSDFWYEAGWHDGSPSQFVAVSNASEAIDQARMGELSIRELTYEDWTIYVFDGRVPF